MIIFLHTPETLPVARESVVLLYRDHASDDGPWANAGTPLQCVYILLGHMGNRSYGVPSAPMLVHPTSSHPSNKIVVEGTPCSPQVMIPPWALVYFSYYWGIADSF